MLTGVAVLLLLSTYQASQWVPEFYAAELAADATNSAETAHQLEQRILDVYNAVQNEGEWRVTISDDQINGWLASQLQKQFPYLLPHHASDPRVRIQNMSRFSLVGIATVACRLCCPCLSRPSPPTNRMWSAYGL